MKQARSSRDPFTASNSLSVSLAMAMKLEICVILTVFSIPGIMSGVKAGNSDTLMRHEKYILNRIQEIPHDVIPHNNDGPVVVRHMMSLNRIIHVDVIRKTLELSGWEMIAWIDQRLAWEDDDFIQVDEITVPLHLIWRPDVILYNSDGSPTDYSRYYDQKAHIHKNGTVRLTKPMQQKSLCKELTLSIGNGDHVICTLVFGSWNYDLHHIEVKPEMTTAFTLFSEDFNSHWSLVSANCKQKIYKDSGMFDFTTVNYSLTLKFSG